MSFTGARRLAGGFAALLAVGGLAAVIAVGGSAACANAPTGAFSVERARAHVQMLGGTIGVRSAGTEANRLARKYIVAELERSGFTVRVQEADAIRAGSGVTTHVFNVIAVKAGARPDAIALVSHYDSTPSGAGAADAGLGVAVCLEAGRVLATRASPRCSLVVALTDAEEMGLRGALALRDDPAWAAVRVFLNFEAVGTSGPSALFEAGPGNAWLVKAWARHAPSPFGGSFATEVYRHLPNSTDFAVLAGDDRPGLNFAPIGNSYAYHTHLDTPERLSDETIAQTGSGAVAMVQALDREDLSRRTTAAPLFFDVGGLRGVVAEEGAVGWLAGLAIVLGLAALIRLVIAVRGSVGLAPLLWSAAWALAGVVVVTVFMVAAGWVLRAASGVNHPWYAHPDRHFAVLGTAGVLGWWFARWIAARVPPRFGPCRHPACAWGLILLVWIAVAALAVRFAPGASYLLTIPLLCAGLTLVIVNARSRTAVRLASIVPAAAAVLLCLRPAWMLLHFMVPNFGRQAMVTPVFVYPAMLLVFALLLLLPVLPLFVRGSARPAHPSAVTAVILLAFASAFGLALAAPAYDAGHPRYCQAQYVQDATLDKAWWEVGANEDGVVPVDTAEAPAEWARATGRLPLSTRLDSMGGPFVFRAPARAGLAPPARFTTGVEPRGDVIEVTIRIARVEEGSTVVVSLPERVSALTSRPPGAVRLGHWQSRLIAPPPGGVEFHLTLRAADAAALANARLLVFTRGLPGGNGPLGLPAWLPQTDATWYARTVSILPIQSQ